MFSFLQSSRVSHPKQLDTACSDKASLLQACVQKVFGEMQQQSALLWGQV